MKKNITLNVLGWLFASMFGQTVYAQNEKIEKEEVIVEKKDASPAQKETQEIIIRKKGDKDTKVTIEIAGNKVLINGKPMAEFKEDGITINNRKMIIRDGNKITMDFNGDMLGDLDNLDNLEGLSDITIDKFDDRNMLSRDGEISKTFLGVGTEKDKEGAKITRVEKGSPAEKAGLQKEDIIYKVEDKKIDGMVALSEVISAMKPDDNAKIFFLRDGKKKDVTAKLALRKNAFGINRIYSFKMPNGKSRSFSFPTPPTNPSFDFNRNFNFDGERLLIDTRRPKLGIKIQDTEDGNGVKVLDVEEGSASATAGLLKDDIVTEIGGAKVTNTDEAREQLRENAEKSIYNMKAKRAGKEIDFTIKIPKKLKTANL
jgi:serine protease Do